MKVLEISVQADAEGAEAVAAVFNEYAYGGAVVEQTVNPDPGESMDPARPFTVRAVLLCDGTAADKRRALEEATWHLAQMRPLGDFNVRELEEADWANAWKKFYTVLHIGARTIVKPSWLTYAPQPDEIVVELDPGMAFGTGLHPTTRLCLAALEQYARPGFKLLDVGTGSGILAIAGAKLGAREVEARDIDPIAVETAAQNVELNHVAAVVHVSEGSISPAGPPGRADVITANILAEVIVELAPALAFHLAPGGVLIASGILADKAELIAAVLQSEGLHVLATTREDDWVAISAQ